MDRATSLYQLFYPNSECSALKQAEVYPNTHVQLLLIDSMSTSTNESDAEAAETLQHSIYYNGDILDTALTVVAQYKDQSIAYLDSVIHFAYVLLRMLEKYSKNKGYMFVRKKKARRAKKKAAQDAAEQGKEMPEEYAEDEGALEEDKEGPSYAEHQFTFNAFEQVSLVLSVYGTIELKVVAICARRRNKYLACLLVPLQRLRRCGSDEACSGPDASPGRQSPSRGTILQGDLLAYPT